MNLDMWFKADIANVLTSIATVARQSAGNQSSDWQAGFITSLSATCAAFGITPDKIGFAHERPDGATRFVRPR